MRLFLPREHGAYAQLGFPLAAGLALGDVSAPAALMLAGGLLAFWSHEPLLIATGQRGARRRDEDGRAATLLGAGLAAGAVGALVAAVVLQPSHASGRWLALPAVLGAGVVAAVLAHREKTAAGELLAATALASWGVPVAIAGGATPHEAIYAVGTLTGGFWLADLAVRHVIRAGKQRATTASRVSLLSVAALAPALLRLVDGWLAAAILPFSLFMFVLVLAPPHARNLKLIGWLLVVASAISTWLAVSHAS